MYIVFDLETTGLPITTGFGEFPDPKNMRRYDPSRIVQMAWSVIAPSFSHEQVREAVRSFIVRRDGFEIHNSRFHGITNERSDAEGRPLPEIITAFLADAAECDALVAHNLAFDYSVLMNHCYRYGLEDAAARLASMSQICTMQLSMPILKIPRGPGYKAPSLNELHAHFFGGPVENAHDAAADVDACARCFIRLMAE